MFIQIKAWFVFLFIGLFLAAGVFSVIGGIKHVEMTKKVAAAEQNEAQAVKALHDYERNKGFLIKDDAEKFLRAFLETDKSGSSTAKRIIPYTTKKARAQVWIPGEKDADPDDPVKISSKLIDIKIYHTQIRSDRASIFAKVIREIRVNDDHPSSTEQMMELQMILIDEKWIVDDVKLIGE